jgi:hypothetical protein
LIVGHHHQLGDGRPRSARSRRVFDFLKGTGFKEDLDDVFARLQATLKRKDFLAARNLDRKSSTYAERLEDDNDITTTLIREERRDAGRDLGRRRRAHSSIAHAQAGGDGEAADRTSPAPHPKGAAA